MESKCLELHVAFLNPRWRHVYQVERGVSLPTGRSGESGRILEASSQVPEQFGCYAWIASGAVMYCGSFSDYSSRHFRTNLEGRIYQYLTNHKRDSAGLPKNTNAAIFDYINRALLDGEVGLLVLRFDSCHLGRDVVDFPTYTTNPFLVRTTEKLLVCAYRRQGRCQWNKE